MKREIKFKGKRIDKNEWVYGHYTDSITTNGRYHYIQCTPHDNANQTYRIRPETVGQFTGLYDKNGKEIYEGDIIRTDGNDFTYEVIYNEKSAAFIGKRNSRVFGLLDLYESDTVCREIIGNIHDNKELLTQN